MRATSLWRQMAGGGRGGGSAATRASTAPASAQGVGDVAGLQRADGKALDVRPVGDLDAGLDDVDAHVDQVRRLRGVALDGHVVLQRVHVLPAAVEKIPHREQCVLCAAKWQGNVSCAPVRRVRGAGDGTATHPDAILVERLLRLQHSPLQRFQIGMHLRSDAVRPALIHCRPLHALQVALRIQRRPVRAFQRHLCFRDERRFPRVHHQRLKALDAPESAVVARVRLKLGRQGLRIVGHKA